jgi:hypothetical protein
MKPGAAQDHREGEAWTIHTGFNQISDGPLRAVHSFWMELA